MKVACSRHRDGNSEEELGVLWHRCGNLGFSCRYMASMRDLGFFLQVYGIDVGLRGFFWQLFITGGAFEGFFFQLSLVVCAVGGLHPHR